MCVENLKLIIEYRNAIDQNDGCTCRNDDDFECTVCDLSNYINAISSDISYVIKKFDISQEKIDKLTKK